MFPSEDLFFSVAYLFGEPQPFGWRFFCVGCEPQANLQTFRVSVTTVKSMQRKRTGEKGSCISHKKIYGCWEEKLKIVVPWSKGRQFCRWLELPVPSVGFCYSIGENYA